MWMTGDLGACWLLDEPLLQNPIKIVHWGLQVRRGGARGPEGQDKNKPSEINTVMRKPMLTQPCVWADAGIVFAVQWHPQ